MPSVGTDLTGADLTGCRIFGISAWRLKLDRAKQHNLVITPRGEPEVIVDDLEVAQFIYLLLDREKIRNVINTVTGRGVLLLGRFGDGGLALLQAVAAWLRRPENGGYLPLLFDFPRPESKTYTDTVRTLAIFPTVEPALMAKEKKAPGLSQGPSSVDTTPVELVQRDLVP